MKVFQAGPGALAVARQHLLLSEMLLSLCNTEPQPGILPPMDYYKAAYCHHMASAKCSNCCLATPPLSTESYHHYENIHVKKETDA